MSEKGQGDQGGFEMEVDLRSDFLLDSSGETVDAGSIGSTALPTGSGTSGGTFDDLFRVDEGGAVEEPPGVTRP